MIHDNSRESYDDIKPELGGRHELIFKAYQQTESAELTDREVKDRLNLGDMNGCRPRITELVRSGYLREVGSRKCDVTNRTVRITAINPRYLPTPATMERN